MCEHSQTISNHVHSGHSGCSLELFDLVETLQCFGTHRSIILGRGRVSCGKEPKNCSGFRVWAVSMGSVRTFGASRLLGALGGLQQPTAIYEMMKIRPRILLVDSFVHCAWPNAECKPVQTKCTHGEQEKQEENTDIK